MTIDKLPYLEHTRYAERIQSVEATNKQLRLDQAATIPPQTKLDDIYPKLSEMEQMFGASGYQQAPFAYFFPPKLFRYIRRSPFAFHCIAPSLGSLEEQEETEEMIASIPTSSTEEKQEKEAILTCFKQLYTLNRWLGTIIGRIGQYLKG